MFKVIFEDRKKQLENQHKIDQVLHSLKNECPNLVSEYLLLQRNITRDQQYSLINSGFISLPSELKKQLHVNELIQTCFLNEMTNFQTCQKLKGLLNFNPSSQ